MLKRYGHGTPNDWIERNLYIPFGQFGPAVLLLINLALFGFAGIIPFLVQVYWIPFWLAGMINGVSHHGGYRNYNTKDNSRNVFPIGIIACGEELHNNHHAFASSAKFSIKPWEFDMGWMYLRIFEFFRLVKITRTLPSKDEMKKASINIQPTSV